MNSLGKKTVELKEAPRASRIRRDPVRAEQPRSTDDKAYFDSREWEIAAGIIGVVLFALALNVIWLGFSAWMGR